MVWERKPKELREDDAAKIIQSVFRSRQARKALWALKVFKADKEYIAIAKVQHILRRKLRKKRYELMKKKQELERLKNIEKEQNN